MFVVHIVWITQQLCPNIISNIAFNYGCYKWYTCGNNKKYHDNNFISYAALVHRFWYNGKMYKGITQFTSFKQFKQLKIELDYKCMCYKLLPTCKICKKNYIKNECMINKNYRKKIKNINKTFKYSDIDIITSKE